MHPHYVRNHHHGHHDNRAFPFLPFLAGLAVSPFLFGGYGHGYGYGPYYGRPGYYPGYPPGYFPYYGGYYW